MFFYRKNKHTQKQNTRENTIWKKKYESLNESNNTQETITIVKANVKRIYREQAKKTPVNTKELNRKRVRRTKSKGI